MTPHEEASLVVEVVDAARPRLELEVRGIA